MAAIFEFSKEVSPGTSHRFLLLQNDSGVFTDIARGGPESAQSGFGIRGFGDLITNVEPYSRISPTPAARDWFDGATLKTLPRRLVTTGSEREMRQVFDDFKQTSQQINRAHVPYWPNPDVPNAANSNTADATFLKRNGLPVGDSGWSDNSHYSPGYSPIPQFLLPAPTPASFDERWRVPASFDERWNSASAGTKSARSAGDNENIQFNPDPLSRSSGNHFYASNNPAGANPNAADAERSVSFDPTPLGNNPR